MRTADSNAAFATSAQRATVAPGNYETAGQAFLGFDMSATLFAIDDRSQG
jgi:hypothetical protein